MDFSEEHRTSAIEVRSCAPIESTPLVSKPAATRPAHTRDCKIVGHPDTDRFVTDDHESNYFTDTDDHWKIDGAEVHKVISVKRLPMSSPCPVMTVSICLTRARGLNLFYETTDAPFVDARNGFISIPTWTSVKSRPECRAWLGPFGGVTRWGGDRLSDGGVRDGNATPRGSDVPALARGRSPVGSTLLQRCRPRREHQRA